jgi:two-component system alkaline phosphatase synthesis response regulator PhoP
MKIIVVEDDNSIRELICATLTAAGYEIEAFSDGKALFKSPKYDKADLYLLDIMLPIMDGYEIFRKLKGQTDAPVIFLTAKGEDVDKANGLQMGADDYISKPFGVLEFLARIKSVMRRYEKTNKKATVYELGNLKIDVDSRMVWVDNQIVKLTFKEFELLLYLMENRNLVLSREQILSAVWGFNFDGDTTRTVDIHIRTLRKKIHDNAEMPIFIETIRGYGYKFI